MNVASALFMIVGAGICLFWILFCFTSLRERRPRAVVASSLCAVLFGSLWFGAYYMLQPGPGWLLAAVAVIVLLVALFCLPLGRNHYLEHGEITARVDERDVMFAREEYEPGSERYEAYYARHPELKAVDDRIRRLPGLLQAGGRYFDPVRSTYTAAIFRLIEKLTTAVDGKVNPHPVAPTADNAVAMTDVIKKLVLQLGASEVGIARLNAAYVYSHVGRGPEPWGASIDSHHRFAVVFTLEMDYLRVEAAPRLPITEETARQYLQGAVMSIALANLIRQLGYPARAHIAGSNYQIMLPPVAHDAGLGELGRFGYLISRRHGARVRLGAVTTDLPLVPDRPVCFGVQDFCRLCKRCVVNCPSGSIPTAEPVMVRGVKKWPLAAESCLHYWRLIGTDCGLCLKVCPYSHPRALVHDLVRFGIGRSAFARRVSIHGEDLFYGHKLRVNGA